MPNTPQRKLASDREIFATVRFPEGLYPAFAPYIRDAYAILHDDTPEART